MYISSKYQSSVSLTTNNWYWPWKTNIGRPLLLGVLNIQQVFPHCFPLKIRSGGCEGMVTHAQHYHLLIFTSHSLPFYAKGRLKTFASGSKANSHLRFMWSSSLVNLDWWSHSLHQLQRRVCVVDPTWLVLSHPILPIFCTTRSSQQAMVICLHLQQCDHTPLHKTPL